MIKSNEIWKISGESYREMTRALLAGADLASLAAGKAAELGLAGPGALRIGIKPNLVLPSPAELGATTHTEVVEGIVEYLKERGFHNLVIAEGSWVGDRTEEAFSVCGYEALSRRTGVPLIDTQREAAHEKDCAGMALKLTEVTDRIDFLINVPVLKGHCQTYVTCALKNLKGLLPNSEKSRFHRMGLHRPIAHLNAGIRQDFIVVDHISGDPDFEEGGRPVITNTLLAGLDPVLIDAYACRQLSVDVSDVPYIGFAEKLGVGSADLTGAELVVCGTGEDGSGTVLQRGPVTGERGADGEARRIPKLLDVAYAISEVDSCSACYSSLAGALVRLEEEGLLGRLDTKIGIGQGMQGKSGALGVGRCTKDFAHCIMGCPPSEEKVYEELKAYLTARG